MDDRRYGKVDNGNITKYNQSRKDFGVGENSDEATCIAKGYYLIVGTAPTPTATQYIGQVSYAINGTQIDKSYEVLDIPIEDIGSVKIQLIKSTTNPDEPVLFNGVTYNGGADSAGTINGAVTLAQLKSEATVDLWDIDNVVRTYDTLTEAMPVAIELATTYRTIMLERQSRIASVNAIVIDGVLTREEKITQIEAV